MANDKLKAYRAALDKLSKKYEEVFVSAEDNEKVKKITFDSPQLTYMFSGFGYDRVHHLYGPPSEGKSSIETYIASQCQKHFPDHPMVLYVDFERSFDKHFAEKIGLNCDPDHFQLIKAENIEDAFTCVEDLLRTKYCCCIIMDSDASAPTRTENEDEINKANFGSGALAYTRLLRRFNILISKYEVPLLWISQERCNMQFGAHLPSVTGGSAPPYYATTRNRVTKLDNITENGEIVGIHMRVRNYKNKGGIPFRDAEMDFYFDKGFNSDNEYVDFLIKFEIFKQGGAWLTSEKYGVKVNGKAKLQEWLKEHPDEYAEMKEIVNQKLLGFNELDKGNVDPMTTEDGAMQRTKAIDESSLPADDIADLAEQAAAD